MSPARDTQRRPGPALVYELRGERVVFPIEEGEMFIGRKDDCDLCFPDGSVSKRHVKLVRKGPSVELFDAGSRNGTLVNDERADKCALVPGDVIQIGKITLVFSDGRDDAMSQSLPTSVSKSAKPSFRPARTNDSFRDFDDFQDDESTKAAGSRASRGGGAGRTESVKASRRSRDERPPKDEDSEFDELESVVPLDSKASAEAAAPELVARFTITSGNGTGTSFELRGNAPLTIGTKEGNAVLLEGEGISRYHAEVVLENGAWVLKDLGSRNGVFVGGRKVDLHELATGDEVQIGTVRLRFENLGAAAGGAGGGPKDLASLVQLLKKDPKAFLRTDAGRRAAFGVVASLLLFVIFAGGGGASLGTSARQPSRNAIHEAFDLIRAGHAAEAHDTISRARSSPQTDHPLLRELDVVAKTWTNRKHALTFDWKNAQTTLEHFTKAAGTELRPEEIAWIEAETKIVQAEQANSSLVDNGSRQNTLASDAERRRDGIARIEALKGAFESYRKVARDSALYEGAREQAKKARIALMDAYQKEAEHRIDSEKPDWQAAVILLNEALKFKENIGEQATLQRKIEEYEQNLRDEQNCNIVMEIVSKRDVTRYEEALRLLKTVPETSKSANDAQIYIHWITADRDVRQAKKDYDGGNWEQAQKLLMGAMTYSKDFGEEAKKSVLRRLEQWNKVVKAYKDGCEASEQDEIGKAESHFQSVLSLEPNAQNQFHKWADSRYKTIQEIKRESIDIALKSGLEYLGKQRWHEANERFVHVLKAAKLQGPALVADLRAKIETAVFEANQRYRLLQRANDAWLHDQSAEFEDAKESLLILTNFLPKGDEKTKAKDLHEKIKKRLANAVEQDKMINDVKNEKDQ